MAPRSGPYTLAALPPQVRATALLSAAALVAVALDLPVGAALTSLTALLLPLSRLAHRQFRSGTALTPALTAFTQFWLIMLAAIELLSLASLLGSRLAWTGILITAAVVLQIVDARTCDAHTDEGSLEAPPLSHALKERWSLVVGPMALVLGLLFAQSVYLNAFTGINHTDGQWFYMARSIRYLQDGNLTTYSTINDFLPHLHQSISAYLLLFTGSESSLMLLSTLFGAFACLTIFDLSRLTGAPVSLALLAGLSPLAVPIVSLHLGTANFDLHTATFLLLSIYGLVLAIRTVQTRYLLLSATATALALSMKLTFWFAAPGLAVLWIAALVVLLKSRSPRALARALALAALIVLLGGAHLLRNAWTQGFLLTPGLPEYGESADVSPRDRLDLLVFNLLATETTLLTPDILLGDRLRPLVEDTFRRVSQRLGIELPNGKLYYYGDRSWNDVFDHFRTPYLSDKAGFGAVIPLAVVPAALLVGFDALRRRSVFTLHGYVLVFAALYLVSMGTALKYAPEHVRYLIEMVLPLLVLLPVVVARAPVRIGMVYLVAISTFMLADAYLAYHENEQRPPDRVMTVPRQEQYATFVAPERFGYYEAARALNRKYPIEEWPEIFLFKEGWLVPVRFEYPFMDPTAQRRLTYWLGDLGRDRPNWPGPFLVLTADVAEVLRTRFAEQVVLDWLSDTVWLALPRDRLRVIWKVQATGGVAPATVRIEAVAGADQYRRPEYEFVTVDTRTGQRLDVLRDFSPDPSLTLSSSALSRVLDVQVAVREAGQSSVSERVTIPERRVLER